MDLAFLGGVGPAVGAQALLDDNPGAGGAADGGWAVGAGLGAQQVAPGGGRAVGALLAGAPAQTIVGPGGGQAVGADQAGGHTKARIEGLGFTVAQGVGCSDGKAPIGSPAGDGRAGRRRTVDGVARCPWAGFGDHAHLVAPGVMQVADLQAIVGTIGLHHLADQQAPGVVVEAAGADLGVGL